MPLKSDRSEVRKKRREEVIVELRSLIKKHLMNIEELPKLISQKPPELNQLNKLIAHYSKHSL